MSAKAIAPPPAEEPLISARLLRRMAALIVLLTAATMAVVLGGRWLGQHIALAGHTDSSEPYAIDIGDDRLRLPANMIRFREQRRNGPTERVDIYLTWPELKGYSSRLRRQFDGLEPSRPLLFLQLTPRSMSRDMSGRVEPIYAKLFSGAPQAFGFGLTLHRLRSDSGYGGEVLLTAQRNGEPDYAVRCLLPSSGDRVTGGDCQRDLHIGEDMSLAYRFPSKLLKDWRAIDAAMRGFVEARRAPSSTSAALSE